MQHLARSPRDGRALEFQFQPPPRSGRVVFELEQARIAVGDRTLIEPAELWLERGEHVSLVGPNGSGKTTLVRTLVEGQALPEGRLRRGHNVKLAYLPQAEHADALEGLGARTVLEATQKQTGLTPNRARALLGRFLFSGEEAEKPLQGLSGGERRRLSLAILVHSGANVLVLDEPTNHLDLESREALEDALRVFEGSVLLVSHDRALLDAVGSRTVAVEDGALRTYTGGWAEYLSAREERKAIPPPRATKDGAGRAKNGRRASKETGRVSKNAQKRTAELERQIEAAEQSLAAVEDELADPAAWADAERAAQSAARHQQARQAVEELYHRLEATLG
jgi:ATP-binding cassette subfamily F protein 3